MQPRELDARRRTLRQLVEPGGRDADLPGNGVGPRARVERGKCEHAEGDPAKQETRVGRPGDLEADGLEHARDDQHDHREHREPIESREHATEQRARFTATPGRSEQRGRDRRAEHERSADKDRERQVIEELEQVERQRLHRGIRAYREFPTG